MGLDDIAAKAGTTTEPQQHHGIPTVHGTDSSLTNQLQPFADDLPCPLNAAATLLKTQAAGTPIDESARHADLTPVTAAKTLHRLGVDGICPLTPTARDIVRDWISGDLSRSDAITLTNATPEEFALTTYIETHDPLPGAREVLETLQTPDGDPMVEKRDHLQETMTDAIDLA